MQRPWYGDGRGLGGRIGGDARDDSGEEMGDNPHFGGLSKGKIAGNPHFFGIMGGRASRRGGVFAVPREDSPAHPSNAARGDLGTRRGGIEPCRATSRQTPPPTIKTPPRRLIHRGLPVRDGGFRPRGLGADARGIKMRFLGLAGARATPNRIPRALRGRNPTLRHRCGRGIGGATRPLCDWGSGDCKSGWRGLGGPLRSYRRVARRGGVGMAGGAALCTHTGAVGCTPAGVCTHTGAGGCACSDVARRVAIKGAPRFNPPSNGCARASCRGGVFAVPREDSPALPIKRRRAAARGTRRVG